MYLQNEFYNYNYDYYSAYFPNTSLYYPYYEPSLIQNGSISPVKEENQSSQEKIILTRLDLLQNPQKTFKKAWTTEEDEKLVHLVQVEELTWNEISKKMENRNYKMCHGRYQKILKGLKEVWSPEEDEKIKTFISVHGKKWKKISQELPGRKPESIRQRYEHFLRPNLVHERWTIDEDLKLIDLINKHGKKWNKIEAQMKTRSHNEIKNRYYHRILSILKLKEKGS